MSAATHQKHLPANGLYRRAWSQVLRGPAGYDRVPVAERAPGDRVLTVVEDSDGVGPAYAHYFKHAGEDDGDACAAALAKLATEYALAR